MQKAVIYCRVSTDEQAEHGTSLQTQEQACLKKAAELAAQVVCIRRDEGVSGSLYSTRPGVQDALADLETGIANILIAYDVSRLSRDVEHHALISKRVKAANSRIVYCTQDFADNVDGELQSGIMKQFAQWEKGKIRERTMSGRRRLAESGLMPIRSRSAYGYHIVTKADALRNTYPDAKAGEYVIVEEQARWIRKMFAWYAAGESAIAICLRLHEQGVPTANGGFEWRQPTVRYLLQNAAYKGEVISHKQETRRDESRAERGLKKITYSVTAPEERWVRIPIPAIVDERLWNICQERLEINKEFLKGNPNNKFMLTGLLRCPVCGHSMGGRRDGKEKQYLSYMCRQHAKSRNTSGIVCNSKRYPGPRMEQCVMATLVDIARDPEYIEAALSAFDDHKRSTSGIEIEAERRRLQGELEGLRQQEQATVRAQIAGIRAGASAEAYAAVFADIAKKRLTVEKRLLQLTPQQEVQEEIPQDTAAKIAKIAEEIVKVLSASELKSGEKQAILTTIIKSIIPTEEGLEIQLNASNHKIIKTACPHDCPDTCSMLAFVQDGKLLRVAGNPDNPYTRGNLCRKVAHYEERVYSPDRLLHPLRRVGKKGVGQFERISWDEALAEIARNWKAVIRESGPEAIMPYSYAGTMGVVSMSACDTRLWYRMGATQLLRTICSSAAKVGAAYVNGPNGGMDPEDFANSQFIIAWGTNLSSTNVHQMPIIREAQAKGAVFVVIDPYKTRTANAADWFIQPKPGTDAALALGMANILFTEGLHDEAFLEAHSVGWREFRERCAEYPPERVAQITGLEVAEILKLARDYATITPSAIRLGTGLSRTANGGGMIRAISCLPAVIGAWGKPASGIVRSTGPHFPLNMNRVHRPDLLHSPDDESPVQWGRAVPRAVNMNELGKALRDVTDPPLRSLYIFDCNPAAVAPNASLVRQGLAREDIFTVVHEQMMTDTARYADILLPATSQMECLDLMAAYGHLYVNLCQPAIPPLGESRANIEVINALAKAMGYDDPVFDETAEDVIRAALNSDHPFLQGITYESLLETGFAHLNTPTTPYVPFVNGEGFPTPSGKVELYSERAAQDGYDPLPNYEPPAESAEADPELAAEFPVNLLSPAAHHFLNSTFSNVASLQKSEKEPRIWVNPQDAQERGVGDGDWLRVWNRRGSTLLKAVVSENVRPGVAWSPSLWWNRDSPCESNVNVLTSDRLSDMGGGSTFHTNLIQFARAEE